MSLPVVILKPGKEQSLKRFHPWVFSGAVKHVRGNIEEGDLVTVEDSHGNFLARGHYQIGSITVRVVSFSEETIDASFWHRKLEMALKLRQTLGLAGSDKTNAFRLVHGEGDGFPGLIIDMYDSTAVVQMHTVAMYRLREMLVQVLRDVLGDGLKAIYEKSEGTLPFKAGVEPVNGFIWGRNNGTIALENGLKFNVDWEKGQKTGFFVDQRDNRALLEKYSDGRSVLNMFCYTGGFSFYAMRGNARLVHSVDSSERAVELTRQNVQLNFPDDSRHEAFAMDAFKFMESSKEVYDLVILDPPAFAKHLKVLNNALQGYRRLNAKALEMIAPGGILFTFSCSQVVSKEAFRTMIFSAAARSGRKVRVLHQLSQPADHPVDIYHPEGEYLKGLVLFVE
ncbi:class I SAM-dependent rRNA methyltransferase [Geofilum sp. OHC36d9]|uniref:class I SAM-dependent rRNA methyltransferase n=1 Tax=Geofilum sp. OHC36d9 TaxID=3458413 RepID=UPI0040347CA1